ncbi:MAG: glycosyltransferase family 1 protein [Pseudomonadota bacterium]
MTLYLEISPLQEAQFTGVSVVTERLADHLLRRLGDDLRFFLRNRVVPRPAVEALIEQKSGGHLRETVAALDAPCAPLDPTRFSYALFPHHKTAPGAFTHEAQIIHDFSTVLTPQFQRPETIARQAPAFRSEIWSNHTTFCVSRATLDDAALYFDAERRTRLKVLSLGCDWDPAFVEASEAHRYGGAKPYVLVLATLEPRKNIDVLLRAIAADPDLLERYDFLFLGRAGWGEGVSEKLGRFDLAHRYEAGLYFPGFVSEFAKYVLLKNAHLVVYPSIFEGFGLPVLEALSLGKHVLTSISSSLTEVGGEACEYFDPNFPDQFPAALRSALGRAEAEPFNEAALIQASLFSWERAAGAILEDYEEAAERVAGPAGASPAPASDARALEAEAPAARDGAAQEGAAREENEQDAEAEASHAG